MNKQKQLEELIALFHKEIPGILELKFGCEVSTNLGKLMFIYKDSEYNTNPNKYNPIEGYYCLFDNAEGIIVDPIDIDKKSIKIIGRPITLADVLRVIENKIGTDIFIDQHCLIYLGKNDRVFHPAKTKWLPHKDFNNQSEEFYNWLYELLIKTV